LDAIQHELNKEKVKNIRICGKTNQNDRKSLVDYFQEKEECKAAILSIRVANVGLNMTAASIVVFAEMDWTPGNLFQAEDRCHRIGQTSTVSVQYLVAKGTIDEEIWKALDKKLAVVGTTLDGDQTTLRAQSVQSKVSTHHDNEVVSLVLEKVDNYQNRKARMERRAEIRKTRNLDGLDEADNVAEELGADILAEDEGPERQESEELNSYYSDNSFSKNKTKILPTTKTPKNVKTLSFKQKQPPPEPFNPIVQAKSTSLSRMQKFRRLKEDVDDD